MKKYRTVLGDTWDHISYKEYGDYSHIQDLISANKEHMETVMFSGGIELNIPETEAKTSTNLPPWKRG